jgi:hypothetical protein
MGVHHGTSSSRSSCVISQRHLEAARTSSDSLWSDQFPRRIGELHRKANGLPLVMTGHGPSPGTSAAVVMSGERRSRWEGLEHSVSS